MKSRIRVVLVEDNEADAELVARALRGPDAEWIRVQAEPEYLRALEALPDIVVSDYAVPGFSGLRALELLRARSVDTPFILVSGTIGEEKAAEAIRLGADDYLLKDRMARLPVAVANAVRAAQERAARRLADERIRGLNRVYAVLSGINAAVLRTRDEHELLQEACRIAIDAGRFVMAWIGLVEGAQVRPIAAYGRGVDEYLTQLPPLALRNEPAPHSLTGQAIASRKVVVANDVKSDDRLVMQRELERRGVNALVMLPLLREGDAIGVLALYAESTDFFDDEELRLLGELAGDVSYALDHLEKARKVDYLSYYDPLTDLANRSLFHERLRLQLEDAARENARLALIVLDVERFRTINDSLGRQAGDALLVELAKRLRQGALPTTWFARLEADRFAIVMPGLSGSEEVGRRVERRIADTFCVPFEIGGEAVRVGARGGIALFPDDAADADGLLRDAEAALKKAKATGERYVFHTQEMTARIAGKLALEKRLRRALESDEFVLHYQPKFEPDGRTIAGLEALIRWQSPDLGLVPPAEFVPLLEETGFILEVGYWALRRATLDQRAWSDAGLPAPRVAVNVSAVQLRQRNFVKTVEHAVAAGPAPVRIDLELTESLVMEDIEASVKKLTAVHRLGFDIAIDDFGTGYSSLYYLARLPVQALKIDRSFVAIMTEDPAATTLVNTMISLAHSLRLKVIAEGVETEQQAKMLRLLRCDQLQGYLFSKPLASEQVVALLQRKP